jgi:hypothetical protein
MFADHASLYLLDHDQSPWLEFRPKRSESELKGLTKELDHLTAISDLNHRFAVYSWRHHPIRQMLRFTILQRPMILGYSLDRILSRYELFKRENLGWEHYAKAVTLSPKELDMWHHGRSKKKGSQNL